jgi:tetratricopeptide (TPR) repeat protein
MALLDEVLMLNAGFEVLQEDRKLLQRIYSGKLTREAYLSYQKAHPYQTEQGDNPLSVLSEALDECPDFLEARLRRVVLLAEGGDVRNAIQELEVLRSEEEAAELIDFHLAGLSWQEGDVEKARKVWKQCVDQDSNPWSQLAQANLDSLGSGSGHLQLVSLPHSKKRTPLQQER